MEQKIPVILYTDIGEDIDDSWALIMMLKQPQLKPLMILTDTGDTAYRGAICAKLLQIAGREEIEIGLGLPQSSKGFHNSLQGWLAGFQVEDYGGGVHRDGVGRMIELIMDSPEPVTVISITPAVSMAEALRREPRIAGKVRLVGMYGSIWKRHEGEDGAIAEYNVVKDIRAAQALFQAPWRDFTITPLDTCGLVRLRNDLYRRIEHATDPVIRALMASYNVWKAWHGHRIDGTSSLLFDTVAVHLASSTAFLKMETMILRVDEEGYTRQDPVHGQAVEAAIEWENLEGYCKFLVDTLLN